MKIISWNTNGLRATVKQGFFTPLFAFSNPDIVCLQETKCEPSQLDEATRNLKGYYSYFSHSLGKKGYSGVALYSKIQPEKVELGIGLKEYDDEGRIIVAYYPKKDNKPGSDFVLINCYFPNGGMGPIRLKYKLEFYDAFLVFINKLKGEGKNVIFCGDINTAHNEIDLARPRDNQNTTGFLPIERAWLDQLINNGWVDVYRHLYPNQKDVYTYWDQITRARDRNVGWRIDYFFVNQAFLPHVKGFKTMTDYLGSDHCPIMLELK